eukprot:228476-Chlamydomonas_euryale.AAC.1
MNPCHRQSVFFWGGGTAGDGHHDAQGRWMAETELNMVWPCPFMWRCPVTANGTAHCRPGQSVRLTTLFLHRPTALLPILPCVQLDHAHTC